jgi:hypothetical protein
VAPAQGILADAGCGGSQVAIRQQRGSDAVEGLAQVPHPSKGLAVCASGAGLDLVLVLDLVLEPDLVLDLDMEPDLELEPVLELELEPDLELEPELELEPDLELEPEPEPEL